MHNGNHFTATKLFEKAFHDFRKSYRKAHASLPETLPKNEISVSSAEVNQLFSWVGCNTDPVAAEAAIYCKPIQLHPDFPLTRQSCGFLSTSITLNLAMAHHSYALEIRKSITSNKSNSKTKNLMVHHLNSAMQYYEFTIRLEKARTHQYQPGLTETSSSATDSSTSATPLLSTLFISPFALMVILNNMGQLNLVLENSTKSEQCYQHLHRALMYLLVQQNFDVQTSEPLPVPPSESSTLTESLPSSSNNNSNDNSNDNSKFPRISRHDLQVFLDNVMLGLQLSCPQATAAAA
jgi:hypothetical protein